LPCSVYSKYSIGMALTYQSSADRILTDEQMLARIQQALVDIFSTGQQYTVVGSRSFTLANIGELRSLEREYRKRVLLAKGHVPQNLADMGDSGSDDVPVS